MNSIPRLHVECCRRPALLALELTHHSSCFSLSASPLPLALPTRQVTGIDLVQSQIRVAGGATLAEIGIPSQESIVVRGSAIQCRITSEDPSQNFQPDFGCEGRTLRGESHWSRALVWSRCAMGAAIGLLALQSIGIPVAFLCLSVPNLSVGPFPFVSPSPSRIELYRTPGGPGVRLDGSATTGSLISPHYDSLLVKVISTGSDFPSSVQKMNRALSEFRVRGIKTNIGFLQNVMTHPEFLSGVVTTSFIETNPDLFEFEKAYGAMVRAGCPCGPEQSRAWITNEMNGIGGSGWSLRVVWRVILSGDAAASTYAALSLLGAYASLF